MLKLLFHLELAFENDVNIINLIALTENYLASFELFYLQTPKEAKDTRLGEVVEEWNVLKEINPLLFNVLKDLEDGGLEALSCHHCKLTVSFSLDSCRPGAFALEGDLTERAALLECFLLPIELTAYNLKLLFLADRKPAVC